MIGNHNVRLADAKNRFSDDLSASVPRDTVALIGSGFNHAWEPKDNLSTCDSQRHTDRLFLEPTALIADAEILKLTYDHTNGEELVHDP